MDSGGGATTTNYDWKSLLPAPARECLNAAGRSQNHQHIIDAIIHAPRMVVLFAAVALSFLFLHHFTSPLQLPTHHHSVSNVAGGGGTGSQSTAPLEYSPDYKSFSSTARVGDEKQSTTPIQHPSHSNSLNSSGDENQSTTPIQQPFQDNSLISYGAAGEQSTTPIQSAPDNDSFSFTTGLGGGNQSTTPTLLPPHYNASSSGAGGGADQYTTPIQSTPHGKSFSSGAGRGRSQSTTLVAGGGGNHSTSFADGGDGNQSTTSILLPSHPNSSSSVVGKVEDQSTNPLQWPSHYKSFSNGAGCGRNKSTTLVVGGGGNHSTTFLDGSGGNQSTIFTLLPSLQNSSSSVVGGEGDQSTTPIQSPTHSKSFSSGRGRNQSTTLVAGGSGNHSTNLVAGGGGNQSTTPILLPPHHNSSSSVVGSGGDQSISPIQSPPYYNKSFSSGAGRGGNESTTFVDGVGGNESTNLVAGGGGNQSTTPILVPPHHNSSSPAGGGGDQSSSSTQSPPHNKSFSTSSGFSRNQSTNLVAGGNQSTTPIKEQIKHEKAVDLGSILKNAAMEDKTVIITTLNKAWAEPNSVFDLFLESFRIGNQTKRLLNHLVVVTLDKKAYTRCRQKHSHCFALDTNGTDFSGEASFMALDYLKMMWRRINFLRKVLDLGYNFIFTDTDIMWFRDPFPHFHANADFQISCDSFNGNAADLNNLPNGGFNFVKSNNRSIEFYNFWYTSRERFPGLHDQDVLNKIKFDPFISQIGLKIRFLDTAYFGGFCQVSKDLNRVCTMHANCCIGLDNKVFDLGLMLNDWRRYMASQVDRTAPQYSSWSVPERCGPKSYGPPRPRQRPHPRSRSRSHSRSHKKKVRKEATVDQNP